jgi:hypothetical protein
LDDKEKIENAQVGLLISPEAVYSLSLNSNINVWNHLDVEGGSRHPSFTIQGHSNYLTHLAFADGVLISAD